MAFDSFEWSAPNYQAGFLAATGVTAVAVGGYAIDRAVNKQGTGGTVAAGLASAVLAGGTGWGFYKQYKMGDDTIETNKNAWSKFGLMGPPTR